MKISKKSQLIELLSGVQVLCLIIAFVVSATWIRLEVQKIVRNQVIEDNQLIASQLSQLIEQTDVKSISYGSQGWERMQNFVEKMKLPNDGYMCIAGKDDGKLLCHPQMRKIPELRNVSINNTLLSVGSAKKTFKEAVDDLGSDGETTVTGVTEQGDASEVVSVANLPEIGSTLFVHQSENGFRSAVNEILIPIGVIGLITGLVLVLVTKKVSTSVLEQYENKLACINENLEKIVQKRTRSLMKTRNAVIFGLAKVAESRDTDTGQHLDRIRAYVTVLAHTMSRHDRRIDETFIENLGLASALHDIGKVAIPDAVLRKPGRFEPEERAIMETHSALGGDCLHAIQLQLGDDDFLSMATEIAYHHHEKWDGTGYPRKQRQNEIPLSARLVALADVYDALTSKRPYKEAMSHEKAREIILEGRGSHFDPKIVDAFIEAELSFIRILEECRNTSGKDDCTKFLSEKSTVQAASYSGTKSQPQLATTALCE